MRDINFYGSYGLLLKRPPTEKGKDGEMLMYKHTAIIFHVWLKCALLVADIAMDWSDHAMWWPEKNIWLDKTRFTLDQYNITADAVIYFTPMHKTLRIQLPDLRYIDCNVDFSVRTFSASIALCKELGIRHPEELSLCKPLEPAHLKENYQETLLRQRAPVPTKDGSAGERIDTNTFISKGGRQYHSNGSLNGTLGGNKTPTAGRNGQFHSNPVSASKVGGRGSDLQVSQVIGQANSKFW